MAVILITAVQFMTTVTTLMVALYRDGMQAAIDVLLAMMCMGPRTYRRINRRKQRRAATREPDDRKPELVQLQPLELTY